MNKMDARVEKDSRNIYTGRNAPDDDSVASIVLSANVAKTLTIPVPPVNSPVTAVFNSTLPFYCNARGTATIPVTTEFAFTDSSELSPSGYDVSDVSGVTELSFISAESDNEITVTFYN